MSDGLTTNSGISGKNVVHSNLEMSRSDEYFFNLSRVKKYIYQQSVVSPLLSRILICYQLCMCTGLIDVAEYSGYLDSCWHEEPYYCLKTVSSEVTTLITAM